MLHYFIITMTIEIIIKKNSDPEPEHSSINQSVKKELFKDSINTNRNKNNNRDR